MRLPKADGRIHSTRRPSRRTLSHINAVLALAEAGRRPETDEHLARAVKAMLAAQRPEGSWEGDPVYQGFNTPFRATQFAVMALVYACIREQPRPRTGTRPIQRPPPSLPPTISRCFWNNWISTGIWLRSRCCAQIRKVLTDSDQPLAREAAARALGHMADPGALPVLIKGLGDPTKMVQVASAYALRMVLVAAAERCAARARDACRCACHRRTRAPAGERLASSTSISAI